MKKILLVIARLNVGGTAKYLYQLAKLLPEQGYEVRVITGNVQGDEKEDPVVADMPIARLPHLGRRISPINDILARRELRVEIDEFEPDIIYSHTFKAGLLVRSLKLKQPVIHAFHGHSLTTPEFGSFSKKLIVIIERLLASRCDRIVTVGQNVARDLIDAGIGKKEQYFSIAPGVPIPEKIDRDKAQNVLGIEVSGRVVVSWLGRFTSVKGPERVLEVAKSIPNALFIMAGGGELFEDIEKNCPPNLILVGWQDSNLIYSISDLVINTSLSEGMPVALIEAQLAELPIVALSHGSVSETVSDKKTGLLYPDYGEDFIEGISLLVNNHDLRKKMGSQAIELATQKFLPNVMVNQHVNLFESVIMRHAYKPRSS